MTISDGDVVGKNNTDPGAAVRASATANGNGKKEPLGDGGQDMAVATGGTSDTRPEDEKRGDAGSEAGTTSAAGNGTRTTTSANDDEIRDPPKRGDKDPSGCEIQNIFSSTRQFFIYEADHQIRYLLPANYAVAKALRQRITDLGGLRASVEDLRADPSLATSNEQVRAAREISWALALAFEDEAQPPSEQPKEILTRVDTRLRSLVKSHYRKKYVLANLAAFCAIEVILILIAIVFLSSTENMAALHRYAIYGAFGGLGAFLSVITGIRSVDVDITLKTWEHIYAGATRIFIGVIGALVVGLALDSAFIDPTFGNLKAGPGESMSGLNRQLALSFIFAFIGGFSESLVPNLLRRGEQAAGASDRQNTASDPIVKDMKP